MNKLPNGEVAVGAPGSPERLLAEARDQARGDHVIEIRFRPERSVPMHILRAIAGHCEAQLEGLQDDHGYPYTIVGVEVKLPCPE